RSLQPLPTWRRRDSWSTTQHGSRIPENHAGARRPWPNSSPPRSVSELHPSPWRFSAGTATPASIRSRSSGATRRSERSTRGRRTCSWPRSPRRSLRSSALAPGEALQEVVRDSARAAPQRENVYGQGHAPAQPGHRSELRGRLAEKRPEHEEQRPDDARDEKEHALDFGSV